jgi:DNA-3-methyladenine glycosylase II
MTKRNKPDDAAALTAALRALGERDHRLARAAEAAGPLPERGLPKGFATLAKIIVEQQLSVAAADAIWRRIKSDLGRITPQAFLARDVGHLRALGLGARKAEYVQGIAQAVLDKTLKLSSLANFSDQEAIAYLTAIRGVGPWTAEIYLLFAEGRGDIFPAGDVALQAAAHAVLDLPARPDTDAMRQLAEQWRPHRGVAARLLWRYYRLMKEGG